MVLVTGGTGFIGAYILQCLVQKGIAVRAIRRSNRLPFFIPSSILNKVQWVEGNVLDVVALQEAMQGVQGVIHSAAVVSFHAQDRKEMYQTNIEGTANVVNAAIDAGVARFIHLSSVAALGRTKKGGDVTEDRQWTESKSNTHYAISKHHAELEAWRGFAEGMEGVILNPSTVLGYGDWHSSSCALFKNTYKGFPWYTTGINGFVGVQDVAAAAVQLLQSNLNQKRFIVSAENWSFERLLQTIATHFKKEKPHLKATPFLGELAWRMEGLKSWFTQNKPLVTKETARVAHNNTTFNNTALLRALPGFAYTPLDAVIQQACALYLQAIKDNTLSVAKPTF